MQALETTSLRILPTSQSNHSTNNLGKPGQFGKHEPPIGLVRAELPALPFGQAPASTDPPARVPYQAFLALVSFVASIVFSLGITAAQSFATSQSFFGSDLSNGGALSDALFKSSRVFAWAGALAAMGLMMSLALQLLLTDQIIVKGMHHHKLLRAMVIIMAWLSIIIVCGSIACIAEAVKVIDQKAGLTIQVHYIPYLRCATSNQLPIIVVTASCWARPARSLDLGKIIMSMGVII